MKSALSLLTLAAAGVLASEVENRGYEEHHVDEYYTTWVDLTYTSFCPTTKTIYEPTRTYCITETITSEIITHVPTTYYETVHGPKVTEVDVEVDYKTITSLCPVTEVKTIEGKTVTVTYTTTKLIRTHVPTTIEETITSPGKTKTEVDVVYTTITSVCPVTTTTTVSGSETVITYLTTSVITAQVSNTVVKTITGPGNTQTQYNFTNVYKTQTNQATQTYEIPGPQVTYTSQVQQMTPVPTAAAAGNPAPVMALMAGLAGALALL